MDTAILETFVDSLLIRGNQRCRWPLPLLTSQSCHVLKCCPLGKQGGMVRLCSPILVPCVPAVQKICAFSTEATMDFYGKQSILFINPWLSFSINYSPHVEQHHYSISSKNERERSEFEHCLVLRVMEVKRLSLRSIIWLLNYKAAMIVTWIIAPCMVSLTTVY